MHASMRLSVTRDAAEFVSGSRRHFGSTTGSARRPNAVRFSQHHYGGLWIKT